MADYISREEVLKKFLERGSGYINELTMRDMINEIPAANVQPVKHGRCVIDNEGYERCSVCNEHETGMRYFTFCPRCGAKLKGDTE